MDITPFKSKHEHARALKEIERLMGAECGTPEGDRLDEPVSLVGSVGGEMLLDRFTWTLKP